MKVRPAETRDIPTIIKLFVDLVDHHENRNFTKDRDKLIGGILQVIVFNMSSPERLVLVLEDKGIVTHFCSGGIIRMPAFYEHETLAELNWLYPLSVNASRLLAVFDRWGTNHGATARWGFADPENVISQQVMKRDGMKCNIIQYLKPYEG